MKESRRSKGPTQLSHTHKNSLDERLKLDCSSKIKRRLFTDNPQVRFQVGQAFGAA